MEVIQSFTIDHTRLKPGIYVSREDKGFTTFDLRITEPNKEPAVAPAAMHSLEHLMATWFRNSEAKVQMGERPLSRPPATRLPQRVHQTADYPRGRQDVCRRIIPSPPYKKRQHRTTLSLLSGVVVV